MVRLGVSLPRVGDKGGYDFEVRVHKIFYLPLPPAILFSSLSPPFLVSVLPFLTAFRPRDTRLSLFSDNPFVLSRGTVANINADFVFVARVVSADSGSSVPGEG